MIFKFRKSTLKYDKIIALIHEIIKVLTVLR